MIEFFGIDDAVFGHAVFDALDDFEGGLDADIGGNEEFFEVVQNALIYAAFAYEQARDFREKGLFGFL